MREPKFELADNRWIWRVYGSPLLSGDHILAASAVSFTSRKIAEDNYRLHDHSKSDGHGRRLLPAAELNRLLCYAAEMCDGCTFTGYVVRSVPTADRRNWDIHWNGLDPRCKQLMSNAVEKIRQSYNLLDE